MNATVMRRGLLASLALNIFLVGGIAGAAWRWWGADRPAASAPTAAQRGLRFAADELGEAQRHAYLAGLREARREAAATLQTAREGRQEVLRLMAAPQFDRAAITAALTRIREADAASRTRLEAAVLDFAATLSPADRDTLTHGLARRSTLGPPVTPRPGS
ncbi:MAG: periplasmic heavy metal sensor [Ramlibacter sp.]|nr:periplasmic heavy metal sensor [Ramlibacter sp.]